MANNARLVVQIQADLAQAKTELQELRQQVQDLTPTAKQAAQSIGGISSTLAQVKGIIGGVTAAFLSLRTAVSLGNIADDYGQLASRLQMVTSSAGEYNLVQQRIMETADRTYKPLADQQELFIRSSSSMKELGYAANETLDFLDSVSSSLTVNSASSAQFTRAIDSISKSMVSGKLSGNEWQAVMETMPTAIGDIADYLGTTETAVKKMASEGKLSMQTFADAMIAVQKKNAELAENMPTTMKDGVTKLQNHLSAYVGELNQAIEATGLVTDAISSLANVFDTEFTADSIAAFTILAEVLKDIGTGLDGLLDQLKNVGSEFNIFGNEASNSLIKIDTSISHVPANIKAMIQLAVIEIATFIEQTKARVVSLANAVAALPRGISAVKAAYAEGTTEIARLEEARLQSIQAIIAERDKTVQLGEAAATAYKKSKDATEEQTKATKELEEANAQAMQRAKEAAEKYGITLDGSAEQINRLMRSNKLSAGELTSQLNALEKKLGEDVKSAGKTAAQTLEELGQKALQAAALSGASGEELDKLAQQLQSIAGLQQKVDKAKADESAKKAAASSAASAAKANEDYVKGLEKAAATAEMTSAQIKQYELSQKNLIGSLKERAQDALATLEKLEKAKQALENTKTNSAMQVELLRFNGQALEADLLDIETKFKQTTEELKKQGNDAGLEIAVKLFDAQKTKAQLDNVQAQINKFFTNQTQQEQSIQALVNSGQITQYEGAKRLAEVHKQTVDQVKKALPALEQMAQLPGAMGEQARQYLTEINNQLLVLQTTSNELENAFRNGLQDGIESSIKGLVKGTMDLQQALENFLESIASNMLNVVAQNIAQDATNGIMGGLSSLGSLFGFNTDSLEDETSPQATAIASASQEGALAMQQAIIEGSQIAAQTIGSALTGMNSTLGGDSGLFGNVTEQANQAVNAINTVTTTKTAADSTITASAAAATATTQASNTAAAASATAAWTPAATAASVASFGTAAMIGLTALMAVMAAFKAFAKGGRVQGAGTGTSDSIPAWLSNGEHVIRSSVFKQPGARSFAEDFNRHGMAALDNYTKRVRHATGGIAGTPAPSMPAPSLNSTKAVENVNNNSATLQNSQNFYLVDDPKKLGDSIANNDHTKQSILVFLQENQQTVSSIINAG